MGDLLERTAALVGVPSLSHHEGELADLVEKTLRAVDGLEVVRIEDNVIARTTLGRATRVVLGGHLDTVPPSDNEEAKRDGDVLFGLGSADMKGGLAVLFDLAETLVDPTCDVTFVFYACEEIARADSGLLAIERVDASLLTGDAAVLLEPTAAIVEAGCQGVLRVEVVVGGERAHSARPWTGTNAIHRLGAVLALADTFPERRPVIDGCEYRESLQAVDVKGGVAGNVVPDSARLLLSHRFAPDRDVTEALAALVAHLSPALDETRGDRLTVVDSASAAKPSLDHPVLQALLRKSAAEPLAKLGWTDVAFFAERGIPAANFGPGDPLVAHTAHEFVERASLERVALVLKEMLESEL